MQPGLSHQGRHPGDAHRRGHGRALNLLLIRLRLIGDVAFTTPAVRALRRRFPDARITYLVEAAAAPVVRHNPHLDEVLVVERPRGLARLAYDLRLARALRRRRFDLVIDFHGGPRSAWLARATGAPRRIGYAVPGRAWCYTERVPWTPDLLPPRHSVLNQWDLLTPLGVPPADPVTDPMEMAEAPGVDARMRGRLAAAGVPPDAALIVLHVSAGNPFRRWPAASFAEVAARLAAGDRSRRIIITSGPSEAAAADTVAVEAQRRAAESAEALSSGHGREGGQILRCGEFDLDELRWLAGHAALYIGGDSGPLHVAAATTVPVVALFGPTLPDRSLPWRDPGVGALAVDAGPLACRPCHQRRCVPGDFRCLTGIAPDRVLAAAETLLDRRRRR
ncbi:MAG: glycosyltransferase family 9 protein [Acidobacteriota bacterium]